MPPTLGVNLFVYTPVDLRLTVSNNFSIGCGTCAPGYFNVNTEDFTDDVDYILGKHQFAFGGEFIRTGDNTDTGYLFNGNYSFNGQLSGANNNNVGEPLIDFLTGQMNAFSQSRAQQTTYRQTIFGFYAQDTYHFNQRLTVNVGLRWEPNLFQTDKFGRGSTFDRAAFDANQHSTKFPNAPAGSFYYGDAGVPKSFTDNRLANFSPRVALTFDPTGSGKTVFRFGGAIMYDTPALYTSQRLTSNPPFVNEIDLTGQIQLQQPLGWLPRRRSLPRSLSRLTPALPSRPIRSTFFCPVISRYRRSTSGRPAFSTTSAVAGASRSTTWATTTRTSGWAGASIRRPTSPVPGRDLAPAAL